MSRILTRMALIAALLAVALPALPASAEPIGDPAFEQTWERTDRPVADGVVNRTWMWGPEGHTDAFMEPYADAPGGERLVQYFDKTRMEINDPGADPNSIWYTTNGLLAQELITGQMQTGDRTSTQREPADVQVAGDSHPDSPTYATFNTVLDHQPLPDGSVITQTIDKSGNVGADGALGGYGVTAAHYVDQTNHTVASAFWGFMNSTGTVYDAGQFVEDSLFQNPFFAVGYPITEAYWVHVPVGGEWQDVLAQCFERRCLTYTPDNPEGWQVEAGNIGQHYYQWRYGEDPAPSPDPPQDPDQGTRENPVPIGTPVDLGDDWEVTVLNITANANEEVLDENQFNDPPESGNQFLIAEVRATYSGQGSDRFDGSYRLRTVGDSAVSYSTFSDSCGVIPNELPDPEVFTGGTISGNLCWQISSSDANSLTMFDDAFDANDVRTYMALHDDGNATTPPPAPSPSEPTGTEIGSRGNPVPAGTPVEFEDGWEVTVQSVTPNATQSILNENQFNEPPEDGHQFFIARVQATYTGSGSERFDGSFRLRAVGDQAVSYRTFSDSCGVIPDPLEDPETFSGGVISGNLCWQIRSSDAESLVMFDSEAESRTYMALE